MCTRRRVLTLIFATALIFVPPGRCPSALAQSPQMRESLQRTSELRRDFRARQREGARRVERTILLMQQQQMLMMQRQLEWQAILIQQMQTTLWNHSISCASPNSEYVGGG